MENEKHYIEKCRHLIEEKVGWGSSTEWQNQDFEALSERIFKETKVSLSASTLKRVWGKVRYEGTPNAATLNALAKFIGHENWRAFASNGFSPTINSGAQVKASRQISRSNFALGGSLVVVVVGVAAMLFWMFKSRPKRLEFENIVFTSKPVTNTVPNTVVFNYNAKDSNADSVFIQQSWDPARRFRVDKELTEYTSTYYLPGYYRAKLILDETIVAEHDIFIESGGWLATIDRNPIPVYASEDKILQNGIVGLTDKFLQEQKIDLEKERLWTSFFRIVKDEVLADSAFQMETTLKNTFGRGELICQHTLIILKGTEGAIVIPLSIKGCVGELDLQAGRHYDGKTNDLSAFGVDFSDWVDVQCIVENKRIVIRVNDSLVFEGEYETSVGRIVGTQIRFMGTGEIQAFSLKEISNNKQKVL